MALVGAGHGHLAIVHRAAALRRDGVDLLLIAPRRFRYSGLATGILSGVVAESSGALNVEALAAAYGVAYREDVVVDADLPGKVLRLEKGGDCRFDVVSFNIGSAVDRSAAIGAGDGAWPVKPLERLVELRRILENLASRSATAPRIVIAGAGLTGLELAGSLAGLCGRLGFPPEIAVVGDTHAAGLPRKARQRLIAALKARGVMIVPGSVVGHSRSLCHLNSGESLGCDLLVLATGLVAPALAGRLGLTVDRNGRIVTRSTLQSLSDPHVFAVGDCAVIEGHPRPPVGVFGVRAGPVLARNFRALAQGRRLAAYRPQRTWLSIMDLGDGTGLAVWAGVWWMGRSALLLKRWLDLGFMRRMRADPAEARSRLR